MRLENLQRFVPELREPLRGRDAARKFAPRRFEQLRERPRFYVKAGRSIELAQQPQLDIVESTETGIQNKEVVDEVGPALNPGWTLRGKNSRLCVGRQKFA